MEVQCVRLGDVKLLTIDKVYEVIVETDDRYSLINDKGVQKNYSKRLFSVIEEEKPVEIDGIEVKVELTHNELLINVKLESEGDVDFTFEHSIDIFSREDMEISCGIKGAEGLNNFMEAIDSFKEDLNSYIDNLVEEESISIDKGDLIDDELFKSIIESLFEEYLKYAKERGGVILFSTNINNNATINDLVINYLSENCLNKTDFRNPNSGNNCTLWVM